jgi:hypothetical protein
LGINPQIRRVGCDTGSPTKNRTIVVAGGNAEPEIVDAVVIEIEKEILVQGKFVVRRRVDNLRVGRLGRTQDRAQLPNYTSNSVSPLESGLAAI